MVWHHAVREQSCLGALDGLEQDLLEGFEITRVLKDGQPGIGSVEHMIDIAALGGSMWSSHGQILARWKAAVNRFLTPLNLP